MLPMPIIKNKLGLDILISQSNYWYTSNFLSPKVDPLPPGPETLELSDYITKLSAKSYEPTLIWDIYTYQWFILLPPHMYTLITILLTAVMCTGMLI